MSFGQHAVEAVKKMSRDQEILGSDPAGCLCSPSLSLLFLSLSLFLRSSVSRRYLKDALLCFLNQA